MHVYKKILAWFSLFAFVAFFRTICSEMVAFSLVCDKGNFPSSQLVSCQAKKLGHRKRIHALFWEIGRVVIGTHLHAFVERKS